jgi:hypothetical protein
LTRGTWSTSQIASVHMTSEILIFVVKQQMVG